MNSYESSGDTNVGNRFTGVTATSCNYNDVSTALLEERVQIHLKRDKRARHGQAKNPCAVRRFSHRAFRARKASQSRSRSKQIHSIP